MKIVFDTNVLISAFTTKGLCKDIFELCLISDTIITSKYILKETSRALSLKMKMPELVVDEVITFISENSIYGNEEEKFKINCRDKTDIKILKLAIGSSAEYLVTGDKDLLIIKDIIETKIVSPRQFWMIINDL